MHFLPLTPHPPPATPPTGIVYININILFVKVHPVCHVRMDGLACRNHVIFSSEDAFLQEKGSTIFHLQNLWSDCALLF